MKGLIEIPLLDSTHNLGLRCKLERDLFRVVERLSADTGEATCKETVNAIGLTRRIGKQDGNFRPLVGRIPRLSTPVLPPQGALLLLQRHRTATHYKQRWLRGDTDVSEVFLRWDSAPRYEPIPSLPLRKTVR